MSFDEKAKTWDENPMHAARTQAVAEGIRARVPLSASMRAFEYGCGTGLLSYALRPDLGDITLADSSDGMLEVLRGKIAADGTGNMRPMKLDLSVDPLPQERYDIVYTAMTFHHVADIDRMLRDLFALLAVPGYLCVADLDAEDGSFHGAGFDGHNGFDRDDLRRRAGAAGFRSIDFSSVYRIARGEGPERREYPVFLMVAEKS